MKRSWFLVPILLAGAEAWGAPVKVRPVHDAMAAYETAAKGTSAKHLADEVLALAKAGALATDKRDKRWVRRALKRSLKCNALEVRIAAIRGYGTLAMPGTSRDLRRFVDRKKNKREDLELRLAAIHAWGSIHDKGTHRLLLAYIKVPSHLRDRCVMAQAAAEALMGYRAVTGRARYDFLRDFMATFDHIYGSSTGMIHYSRAAVDWFGALHNRMVATFNTLTGQSCVTYRECWTWWKANHRRVKAGKL